MRFLKWIKSHIVKVLIALGIIGIALAMGLGNGEPEMPKGETPQRVIIDNFSIRIDNSRLIID